jgi:hypothetical protein
MPGTQPDNRPALDRTKQTRNAFTEQERLDQQTLNMLAGRRVADRTQAAVRIADLIGIVQMPQYIPTEKLGQAAKLTPITGGEPPTEAEFNTVVNNYNTLIDRHMTLLTAVNRIHRMLAVASTALSRRMRGENSR